MIAVGGSHLVSQTFGLELTKEPAEAQRPPPAALVLAIFLMFEAVISKSRLAPLAATTPAHIAGTLAICALIVVVAALRQGLAWPSRLRALFFLLFALALLSSLAAPSFVAFNVIFWAIWVLHFLAIWWALPQLYRGASIEDRMLPVLVVTGLCAALSVVFFSQSPQSRAVGMFSNSTELARVSALTVVCGFCQWLYGRRARRLWLMILLVSLGLLLLSRTRASIGATLAGCLAAALVSSFSVGTSQRARAISIVFAALILPFLILYLVDVGLLRTDEYLVFFRLTGGVAGVVGARARIWSSGFERLAESGWLGGGFAQKFGGQADSRWGISYPTYDWTTEADPHNMLLTTAIQLGIPAMVVLAVLVAAISIAVFRLQQHPRVTAAGVLFAGLVFGLLDGNWFITFSAHDRISMVVLALMLAAPRSAAEPGDLDLAAGSLADGRSAGEGREGG